MQSIVWPGNPTYEGKKGAIVEQGIEIEEALEIAVDGLTHQNQSCWSTCTVARRDSTGVSTYTYAESRRATRRTALLCGVLSRPKLGRHDYNLVHQDKPACDRLTH